MAAPSAPPGGSRPGRYFGAALCGSAGLPASVTGALRWGGLQSPPLQGSGPQ